MEPYETEALHRIAKRIHEKGVSNDFLVQLIVLGGEHLNLRTISNYARENRMTYRGVKECRNTIELFDCKFVIDND